MALNQALFMSDFDFTEQNCHRRENTVKIAADSFYNLHHYYIVGEATLLFFFS